MNDTELWTPRVLPVEREEAEQFWRGLREDARRWQIACYREAAALGFPVIVGQAGARLASPVDYLAFASCAWHPHWEGECVLDKLRSLAYRRQQQRQRNADRR